ncbi:hypothetical protein F5Y07DRAFT_404500 [Xylaria sp. FL0933]|nr:hypothetical protein F5Y07DRAFT_404500 [Xylaria sp. FL0933]
MALSFINLPVEIVASILEQLDNIKDLPPVLLTHSCFKDVLEALPGIPEKIIQRQIHPHLLPLAVAHMEASDKSYGVDDGLKPIGMKGLIWIGFFHDLIEGFVDRYVDEAIAKMESLGSLPQERKLSDAEHVRFFSAFYRLELFFKLCAGDGNCSVNFQSSRACQVLRQHPPWERQQMRGVYHRLLRMYYDLCNAEEIGIALPDHENIAHQKLLWPCICASRGFVFTQHVLRSTSLEVLNRLFLDGLRSRYVNFENAEDAMVNIGETLPHWIHSLGERLVLLQRSYHPYDRDIGPAVIWARCHLNTMLQGLFFEEETALGEIAYLFWDKKRISQWALWDKVDGCLNGGLPPDDYDDADEPLVLLGNWPVSVFP